MRKAKVLGMAASVVFVAAAAWWSGALPGQGPAPWSEPVAGVARSPGLPAGYALLDGEAALLIDAPTPTGPPGKKVEGVLLTHHHRDSAAGAARFLAAGVSVRAAKEAGEWLTPAGVRTYWKESLPLRSSRTAYLVLPEGLDGIDCSLKDGEVITWRGWQITAIATPGHSRDHVAYLARRGQDGPRLLFCGDAFAEPGKIWSPYTTDWDHWTDAGLKPTAASLRKLAGLEPSHLLPAHGPVVAKGAVAALQKTAAAVEEMGFLKSFERYTKQRLGSAPSYRFLAKEQAESNGSKPWSQVAEHLFLTGNTYVLTSRDNRAFLVVDPWGELSARQIAKLKADRNLGKLEVVLCSHAHYDHYDGVYSLPDRESFEVWALDKVALPIADPARLRAPFLDARPVRIDRTPKDGDTLTWREYKFRFHHLPGQSEFTMGWETVIDGKRCFFTADNWFHQDQFSGTGGWMGLNRSWPLPYAASAQKVLDAAPEWVLAEHGGPFEFSAEDWRRRVKWGEEGARAADALCVSGNHRHDWSPSRIHIEPVLQRARPGETIAVRLVAENVLPRRQRLTITLEPRAGVAEQRFELEVEPRGVASRELKVPLGANFPAGRQVLTVRVAEGDVVDPSDVFLAVDVTP